MKLSALFEEAMQKQRNAKRITLRVQQALEERDFEIIDITSDALRVWVALDDSFISNIAVHISDGHISILYDQDSRYARRHKALLTTLIKSCDEDQIGAALDAVLEAKRKARAADEERGVKLRGFKGQHSA